MQQATRAGAIPVPRVDTDALLQTIGQRRRHALLDFTSRIRGRGDFVAFDRWDEVGSSDDAPRWAFGDAGRTLVRRSSEPFGEAIMASQVTPEVFGVLMFSQLTTGGRSSFKFVTAASALKQWSFLTQHGARVQGTSSLIFDGVQFEVADLTLSPGAPASSCLGLVGIQVGKRVDGFVCRIQGPAFVASQASEVLSQIDVPRFIEP